MINQQYIDDAVCDTVKALHRAGVCLRMAGIHIELPDALNFKIDGIISGSETIVTGVSTSDQAASTDVTTKVDDGTTTNNLAGGTDTSTKVGTSSSDSSTNGTTNGTSANVLSGGNSRIETWDWEEV